MRLNRIVDDAQRHIRGLHLDHRDFCCCSLVADLVHHVRCLQAEQASHFNVDTGPCNAFFPYALFGDGLAKSNAGLQPLAHFLQRLFGDTDRAHAMVDTAWSKAPLRNLEAATFAQQYV